MKAPATLRVMLGQVRILLIAPSLEIVGGQGIQARRLLDRLGTERELKVGFLPINPQFPKPLRWVRNIKGLRTFVNFLLFSCLLVLRVPRFDILHVFTAAYSSYLLWTVPSMLMGRLLGKKVILNYRDGQADDHLTTWRTAVPTLKLAHRIVVPSDFLVEVFRRHGLHSQSIFNVVDDRLFRYRQRAPLRPLFMTNRGLEPLYNVGCVLRAFQAVQKEYSEAHLTIAHDGPCRPELEHLSRELCLQNVRFVGRLSQEQMAQLYDDSDIYIMSPNIDNMPGTVLECYASGIPLISTAAGGVPFIVRNRETGLLVAINDHQAIARCALELLRDADFASTVTEKAYQECEKYRWQHLREQWLCLYRSLV